MSAGRIPGLKIVREYRAGYGLWFCALAVLLSSLHGMAAGEVLKAAGEEKAAMSKNERELREALTKSLQAEVDRVCKELGSTPPTVGVEADLSRLLAVLPEEVSTSPTAKPHPLPPLAVTADRWSHLATIFAKSGRGMRRVEAKLGLSSEGHKISVNDTDVASHFDYGRPEIVPADGAATKFAFDLCGVRVKCPEGQPYLVNVGKRRIGVIFEGDGELALKPTSARSRRMLADFVSADEKTIPFSRLFVACPAEAPDAEPAALGRLRRQIGALIHSTAPTSDAEQDKPLTDFLQVCVDAASPFRDEEPLKGLAPSDGYACPILVVETQEQGVFAFSFAGQRGSETVIVSMPRTGAMASFWESARTSHKWVIPDVKHYSFDVCWRPEAMSFDVKCTLDVSRLQPGRDIRFIMSPACKVQRSLINGEKAQFVQRKCAQEDTVAMSLSSGLIPDEIEGFLQIALPKRVGSAGRGDLTVEYSIDYGDTSATDSLGAEYFFEGAVVLHGDAVRWFPCVGWGTRAPMRTRIEVPAGFMGVAMGNSETKEVRTGAEVYTYDADFPMLGSAFAVGKFTEFLDKAKRIDGLKRPVLSMLSSGQECLAQRYLDDLGTTVDWAQKYCGEFPYERLCFVTMPGNRSWATMMVFPNSWMERRAPDFWLLSHEVAHQWWGNAAGTLKMDDQWMVEGSATYFSFLWSEDLNMRDPGVVSFKRLARWIREFVSPPPISAGFRMGERFGIMFYLKGAYMFEMLRMAMNNDKHFFATLKQYVQHAQKAGLTEAGLRRFFEEATGHDLSGLFSLYVHTGDLPGVLVEVTDVAVKATHAAVSLSAQITPGGYALPYPIDVYPKSGRAPHREVIFIGPDFGDYKIDVPF
ncbi:MAG: hypothetical protein JW759_10400, partial [Candidatus Coatesbacteria bacterium]|nr:hypothetical protein [Candidatus Coatesbacteria bacterium]